MQGSSDDNPASPQQQQLNALLQAHLPECELSEAQQQRLDALLQAHLPEFLTALSAGLSPHVTHGRGSDELALAATAHSPQKPAATKASPSLQRSFSAVQLHEASSLGASSVQPQAAEEEPGRRRTAAQAQHARRASTGAVLSCWLDSCSTALEAVVDDGSLSGESSSRCSLDLATCAASKQQRFFHWRQQQQQALTPVGVPVAEGREAGAADVPSSPAGSTGSCPGPPADEAASPLRGSGEGSGSGGTQQTLGRRSSSAASAFRRSSASMSGLLQLLRGALGGTAAGGSSRSQARLQVRLPAEGSDDLDVREYLACFSPDAAAAADSSRASSSSLTSITLEQAAATDGWGLPEIGLSSSQPSTGNSPQPSRQPGGRLLQLQQQQEQQEAGVSSACAVAAGAPAASSNSSVSCAPPDPSRAVRQLLLSPSPTKRAGLLHGPSRLSFQSFRSSSSSEGSAVAPGVGLARCSSPAVLQRPLAADEAPGRQTELQHATSKAARQEPLPSQQQQQQPTPNPVQHQHQLADAQKQAERKTASHTGLKHQARQWLRRSSAAAVATAPAAVPLPAADATRMPAEAAGSGSHGAGATSAGVPETEGAVGATACSRVVVMAGHQCGGGGEVAPAANQQLQPHRVGPAAAVATALDTTAPCTLSASSSRSSSPAVAALADGMQRIAACLEDFLHEPRSPSLSPGSRSLAGSWAAAGQASPPRHHATLQQQQQQHASMGAACTTTAAGRDQGTQAGPAAAAVDDDAAPCNPAPTKAGRSQHPAAALMPAAPWSSATAAAKARMLAASSPGKPRQGGGSAQPDAAPSDQDVGSGQGWLHPGDLTPHASSTVPRDQRRAVQQQQQAQQQRQDQHGAEGQLPRGLRPPAGVTLTTPSLQQQQQQQAADPTSLQQQQQEEDVADSLVHLACRAAGVDLLAALSAPCPPPPLAAAAAGACQASSGQQTQLWRAGGQAAQPLAGRPCLSRDAGNSSDSSDSSCSDGAAGAHAWMPPSAQHRCRAELRLLSPRRAEPRTRKLRLLRQLPLPSSGPSRHMPGSSSLAAPEQRQQRMLWRAGSTSQLQGGTTGHLDAHRPTEHPHCHDDRLVRLCAAKPHGGAGLQPPVLLRPAEAAVSARSRPVAQPPATKQPPVPWEALPWTRGAQQPDVSSGSSSLADRAAGGNSLQAGRTTVRLLQGSRMAEANAAGGEASVQGSSTPAAAAPLWRPEVAAPASPATPPAPDSQQAQSSPTVIAVGAGAVATAPWQRQQQQQPGAGPELQAQPAQQQPCVHRSRLESPTKRVHAGSPTKKAAGERGSSRRWAMLQRLKAARQSQHGAAPAHTGTAARSMRPASGSAAPAAAASVGQGKDEEAGVQSLVRQLQELLQGSAAAAAQHQPAGSSSMLRPDVDDAAAAPVQQQNPDAAVARGSNSSSSSDHLVGCNKPHSAAVQTDASAQWSPCADAAVQAVVPPPPPPQHQRQQQQHDNEEQPRQAAAEELAQLIVRAFHRSGGCIAPVANDQSCSPPWGDASATSLAVDGSWGLLPEPLAALSPPVRTFQAAIDLHQPPLHTHDPWQQQQQAAAAAAVWTRQGSPVAQPSQHGAAWQCDQQQWMLAGGSPTPPIPPNPGCCFGACPRHMSSPELGGGGSSSPQQPGLESSAAAVAAAAAAAARVSARRRTSPPARGARDADTTTGGSSRRSGARRPAPTQQPGGAGCWQRPAQQHPQQQQQQPRQQEEDPAPPPPPQETWTARQSQQLELLRHQWQQQKQGGAAGDRQRPERPPDHAAETARQQQFQQQQQQEQQEQEQHHKEVETAHARASAARTAARVAARRAADALGQRLRAELAGLTTMLAEVDALAAEMETEQAAAAAAVEAFAAA